MKKPPRLGINIDHVATIRNARGGSHPDPIRAARYAAKAGADVLTVHLREDRRHISDIDLERLRKDVVLPINLEMAATSEMLKIALKLLPRNVCVVPERRAERTTEGGLDVIGGLNKLAPIVNALSGAGIRVSLFVEPDSRQIEAATLLNVAILELHTGKYCNAVGKNQIRELERIHYAAKLVDSLGLECHAGHGLTYDTVAEIAAISCIQELNIGHFLVGEAIFYGLVDAIKRMRAIIDKSRENPTRKLTNI